LGYCWNGELSVYDKVFFHEANAFLLVYDITCKDSFDALDMWLQMVKDNAPTEAKVLLIGNKKDAAELRQVSTEIGKRYAEQHSLLDFLEISAKTGEELLMNP